MQYECIVPDTVRVENVGDSADGKITMDSSETVKIVPDMAKIVFAVTSEAKKADECQQKNTEALNSLTEYLKGQGIDEKSITTSGYSLIRGMTGVPIQENSSDMRCRRK